MKVTSLDTSPFPAQIVGTLPETGESRSTGTLHLSTVYRDMEREAQLSARKAMDEKELAWYGAGGFLWEHVFSLAFQQAVDRRDLIRPGEWGCDGIVGSPDLIDVPHWRVVELKCRWMSSAKFEQLEKYFWLELVQVKGYCKMVDSTEAELWVFFVNGDYRPPRPVVLGKLLQFSHQEIEESWQMIVGHAQRRGWL